MDNNDKLRDGYLIIDDKLGEGRPRYVVTVRVPDLVLYKLTKEQFKEFCIWDKQLELLGFVSWTRVTRYSDFPHCDKVFVIETDEVTKPMLFGHELSYTAEAL